MVLNCIYCLYTVVHILWITARARFIINAAITVNIDYFCNFFATKVLTATWLWC